MGTRANTQEKSEYYTQRSLLIVQSDITTIWFDCAQTWCNHLTDIPYQPDAICITHAHDDHAGGLRNGSPAPVYASKVTWEHIDAYNILDEKRYTVSMEKSFTVGDITITPHTVFHSIHAPANGYKVATQACTLFYAADVAKIANPKSALYDVDIYIGDGSIVRRTMLKRIKDGKPVGHAPIKEQISWCYENHVNTAIFTHCGAEIIHQDFAQARKDIYNLGQERSVYATIAYDGWSTSCHDILRHSPHSSKNNT